MTRAAIGILVRKTLTATGKTAREINSGECCEFADTLIERFAGFRVECSNDDDDFNHTWVSYRGIYYDAETPEGTRSRQFIGTKPGHGCRAVPALREPARPAKCECDNTHEQNDTCCMPCWRRGFRAVPGLRG